MVFKQEQEQKNDSVQARGIKQEILCLYFVQHDKQLEYIFSIEIFTFDTLSRNLVQPLIQDQNNENESEMMCVQT